MHNRVGVVQQPPVPGDRVVVARPLGEPIPLLRKHHAAPTQRRRGDALFVGIMIAVILGLIALGMILSLLAMRAVLQFLLGH